MKSKKNITQNKRSYETSSIAKSQNADLPKKRNWAKILSIGAGFIMVPVGIFWAGYYIGEAQKNVTLAESIATFNLKEVGYKSQIMKQETKMDSLKLEILKLEMKYEKR